MRHILIILCLLPTSALSNALGDKIRPCWNVGTLTSSDVRSSAEVRFTVSPDGRIQSIMRGSVGSDAQFAAATLAVTRCRDAIPPGSYEAVFGPSGIVVIPAKIDL